jgi:hypothetical protein
VFRKTAEMGVAELPLRGSGGEAVDFARTIVSHGVAELPPNRLDFEARALESTVAVPGGARTVRVTEERGRLRVQIVAGSASERVRDSLTKTVRHMFRLDEDLSSFYELVRADSELSWCATGAGRMLRAQAHRSDRTSRHQPRGRVDVVPRHFGYRRARVSVRWTHRPRAVRGGAEATRG